MSYKYTKWQNKNLSLERIDALLDLALSPTTSRWQSIVKGIQLVLIGIVVWTRRSVIAQQMEIDKQLYERNRAEGNQDEVNNGMVH